MMKVCINAHTYTINTMERKNNKEIGEKIKVLRNKQGLTQDALTRPEKLLTVIQVKNGKE